MGYYAKVSLWSLLPSAIPDNAADGEEPDERAYPGELANSRVEVIVLPGLEAELEGHDVVRKGSTTWGIKVEALDACERPGIQCGVLCPLSITLDHSPEEGIAEDGQLLISHP